MTDRLAMELLKQHCMPEPETPLMLLSRMVIQYGYLTLFANSFTLAPILAFWANVLTIRTEVMNTVDIFHRFPSDDDPDVGVWIEIMEYVCIAGVICNTFIFYTTSSAWIDWLHENNASPDNPSGMLLWSEHYYTKTKLGPLWPQRVIAQPT